MPVFFYGYKTTCNAERHAILTNAEIIASLRRFICCDVLAYPVQENQILRSVVSHRHILPNHSFNIIYNRKRINRAFIEDFIIRRFWQ